MGVVAGVLEVPVEVLDGGFEHVEGVPQLVELRTRHDELRLTEPELLGPTPGLVVTLAARSPAVLRRTPGTAGAGEPPPAPPAPLLLGLFRHSDESTVGPDGGVRMPMSAADEAQANLAARVVVVEVDEHE
jgi:hypothetical protein